MAEKEEYGSRGEAGRKVARVSLLRCRARCSESPFGDHARSSSTSGAPPSNRPGVLMRLEFAFRCSCSVNSPRAPAAEGARREKREHRRQGGSEVTVDVGGGVRLVRNRPQVLSQRRPDPNPLSGDHAPGPRPMLPLQEEHGATTGSTGGYGEHGWVRGARVGTGSTGGNRGARAGTREHGPVRGAWDEHREPGTSTGSMGRAPGAWGDYREHGAITGSVGEYGEHGRVGGQGRPRRRRPTVGVITYAVGLTPPKVSTRSRMILIPPVRWSASANSRLSSVSRTARPRGSRIRAISFEGGGIEPFVGPVTADPFAEREVGQHPVGAVITELDPLGRSGAQPRVDAEPVQVDRGQPDRLGVDVGAGQRGSRRDQTGQQQQGAGAAERVDDVITVAELGQPDQGRGEHRGAGPGQSFQPAEAAGPVQRSELGQPTLAVPGEIDQPVAGVVGPAELLDQAFGEGGPDVGRVVADAKGEQAVGRDQGGDHAVGRAKP